MAVRNLKILKGTIYAEVDIGQLANGGWVTMNVKLAKGEVTAVTEALKVLDAAVEAVAEGYLGQATESRMVSKRVKKEVDGIHQRHQDALRLQRVTLAQALESRALGMMTAEAREELRRVAKQFRDQLLAG